MLIPHARPLREGRLAARYDRFIAVVRLGRRSVEAHCVNPGRMEGLVRPGIRAWVSEAPQGGRRRLRYTLELLEIEGRIVGANTVVPNHLAETLIRARQIPGLKRYRELHREVAYGDGSRIDLLLTSGAGDHLVEVKNCHLVYPDGRAYFPDSVSARATAHVEGLAAEVRNGRRATVLFVLQRSDGRTLRPSRLHDPMFADAARRASNAGVKFRAIRVAPGPDGFRFLGTIPVDLSSYDPAALAAYRDALTPDSGWERRGRRDKGR